MNAKNERMQILEMIDSGRISASQGLALLQALTEVDAAPEETAFLADLPLPDGTAAGVATAQVSTGIAAIPLPPPAPEAALIDYGVATETVDDCAPVEEMARAPAETEAAAAQSVETTPYEIPAHEDVAGEGPADQADQAETGWERLETPAVEPAPSYGGQMASPDLPPDAAKWRRWWAIPLVAGAAFTFWGGLFMYLSVHTAGGLTLWFLCASVPFALGRLVMALAFLSRTAPWLHLRVQQKPGETPQRIAISLPLPIGPTAWFLRTFGSYIPQVKENSLDEIILAVGRNATPENPIYIQVDEGDNGEKVEIYIG